MENTDRNTTISIHQSDVNAVSGSIDEVLEQVSKSLRQFVELSPKPDGKLTVHYVSIMPIIS